MLVLYFVRFFGVVECLVCYGSGCCGLWIGLVGERCCSVLLGCYCGWCLFSIGVWWVGLLWGDGVGFSGMMCSFCWWILIVKFFLG